MPVGTIALCSLTISFTNPSGTFVIWPVSGAPITLSVNATDPDGSISQIQFHDCSGNTYATITTPPYSFAWTPPAPYYDQLGFYDAFVDATATDNVGATGQATCIFVEYQPIVTLTSPANGANFIAPAAIQLTATHSTPGGPIQKVQFFNGTTLLGEDFTAPFAMDWQNPPAGSHALTAKAVANDGREYASSVANVTVTAAEAKLHFIEVDHLNTPRLVADATGTTVWKWDQQEPFGNSVADDNPSGLGAFDLPLRLPGQYFDKETNVHHNYFRDYDSGIGRYVQSDPIGLNGGLNTYAYVGSNPLVTIDPTGEAGLAGAGVIGGVALFCWRFPQLCIAGVRVVGGAIGAGLGYILSSSTTVCPPDKPDCQEHFTRCLGTSMADLPGSVFGNNRCLLCRDACVRGGGDWPDIAMTGGRSVRCDYRNYSSLTSP